ncbi:hypothetical protein [Planosporangium thailandense]|uniref:hypothetical protein n=1 Tax=Planosporangium thailandense TaxID=765197 RepID=UPI00197B2D32|nr:hypothetical protein [Planosporangium thailandense]
MRMPLLLFVVLGRHIGADRLASMLLEQRRQQAELLAGYLRGRDRRCESGADPFVLATLGYGIAMARATIRWLDGLGPQLAGDPGTTRPTVTLSDDNGGRCRARKFGSPTLPAHTR